MYASEKVRKGLGNEVYMRWNDSTIRMRSEEEEQIGRFSERGVQRVDCTIRAKYHMLEI